MARSPEKKTTPAPKAAPAKKRAVAKETAAKETVAKTAVAKKAVAKKTVAKKAVANAGTDAPAPRGPQVRTKPQRLESAPALPPRQPDGHKAVFGHVLVLAGSYRYTGAAVLTARAALRSGCGLVTLACPKSAHAAIASHLLCEMSMPLPDAAPGVFTPDAVSEILDFADRMNAVALGPGITTDAPAMRFAQDVAVYCPLPMVIDADGINAFAGAAQRLEFAEGPRVLTPHPGEAARLLGCSTEDLLKDREESAMQIARQAHAVVLLKGANTIVTDAERVYVNTTGNSGMATAGSGDVLTGVIAALLAQRIPAFEAAVLGAYLHGLAGDIAADDLGEHGMIATDILERIPAAFVEHVRST